MNGVVIQEISSRARGIISRFLTNLCWTGDGQPLLAPDDIAVVTIRLTLYQILPFFYGDARLHVERATLHICGSPVAQLDTVRDSRKKRDDDVVRVWLDTEILC